MYACLNHSQSTQHFEDRGSPSGLVGQEMKQSVKFGGSPYGLVGQEMKWSVKCWGSPYRIVVVRTEQWVMPRSHFGDMTQDCQRHKVPRYTSIHLQCDSKFLKTIYYYTTATHISEELLQPTPHYYLHIRGAFIAAQRYYPPPFVAFLLYSVSIVGDWCPSR